ncbi:hypothetical protein D3C87_2178950 [compost metagenome]
MQVEVGDDHVILKSGAPYAAVAAEFKYVLYRQKIFAETLQLRQELIRGILV